jgi:hypothetical protein
MTRSAVAESWSGSAANRPRFAARLQAGAVLLGADGRLGDPGDLVSAEQPRSREGSVACEIPGEFRIDLVAVPANDWRYSAERQFRHQSSVIECRG